MEHKIFFLISCFMKINKRYFKYQLKGVKHLNDYLAIIIAPVLTFFGIWLTNSNNRKVMEEQNMQQKALVEIEHKSTMAKLEREKILEAELEDKDRIRKSSEIKLVEIYYPIVEIYDKQRLENEKFGNDQYGLDMFQLEQIRKIMNQDSYKILLGYEFIKEFNEAESVYVDYIKHLDQSVVNESFFGEGFDPKKLFCELVESKIKELENILKIN